MANKRARHPAWAESRHGETGEVVAEYRDWAWVIPPGSKRPLTFDKSSLIFVGSLKAKNWSRFHAPFAKARREDD